MDFKDVIASKIAKEKNTAKKVASATKVLKKAMGPLEKKQIGALDDNAVGKYNLYQGQGEFYITKRKLKDWFALMDTADTLEDIIDKMEKGFGFEDNYVVYDKELFDEYEKIYGTIFSDQMEDDSEEEYERMGFYNITDKYDDVSKNVKTNKKQTMYRKAAEEDLDVKLKVQKNKPAGLDTSSPKSLPESIRPLMQDLKGKITTLKETETKLANVKADLDAKYQEAKNESKIVEKQAEIENLTQNIGKLLFAAKNETFQFQDNLVALTHQTKTVPAKATDKWKFEKVFAKLQELMGDENAQKFLDATVNGLQSQATEKTITELNIFSPTQKQLKTSDTSDTNKLIDALKEIYTNLRSYFIDVKKANNIIEEQFATGATASKKQVVTKKAESSYKDKIYDAIDMGGEKWVAETLVKWISEDDAERFCKIYELIDVESKKKVNMKKAKTNKKANISKKASVQLNLEIEDYIELLKDRYESAPADWKTRGGKLLINELYEYMENYDGGKVEIPSIVIDNFLINGDIVERTEFTADGEASNKFEKYNGNWEEFCEEEAVIYNDNAACTNLGF